MTTADLVIRSGKVVSPDSVIDASVAIKDGVVIAVLEQLARPLKRFIFGAEIFRPRHPFVASCTGRRCQPVVTGDSIRHLGSLAVGQDVGLPHVSHNSSFRTDALKLGLTELINHASCSVKHTRVRQGKR